MEKFLKMSSKLMFQFDVYFQSIDAIIYAEFRHIHIQIDLHF